MDRAEVTAAGARPVRVAQFGTGNFLRAFVDHMIDIANEKGCFDGDVVMVKQVPGRGADRLAAQGGKYHVILQGKMDGAVINDVRTVTAVRGIVNPYTDYEAYEALAALPSLRFLVSNTTEAGIVYDDTDSFAARPAASYPGRLVQFLHMRYTAFGGDRDRGLIILPVELIEDNGKKLKEYALRLAEKWGLEADFIAWLREANTFCSTLVDRIVSGRSPQLEERFADDGMYAVAEPFGLWVIEPERDISQEFPLDLAGLPVVFTDDQRPYRERKVRILNGTHTAMALISYLCGKDIVADAMADAQLRAYIDRVAYTELAPHVPLPAAEARSFADSVMERFENPFLNHKLLDISLNSVSKWAARDLPTVRESCRCGERPEGLLFSLAALLAFDTMDGEEDGQYMGRRPDGGRYPIREDRRVVEAVQASTKEQTAAVLADSALWGEDLTAYPGLADTVWAHLRAIRSEGPRAALDKLLNG